MEYTNLSAIPPSSFDETFKLFNKVYIIFPYVIIILENGIMYRTPTSYMAITKNK